MSNKCVKCGKLHPDDAKYLINGCDVCGAKFFFYVNENDEKKAEKLSANLTKKQITEMERDVRAIIKNKKNDILVLSIEAVRVLSPGKYELDLINLFNQKPLVIKIGEGKYRIDMTEIPRKER
ncbi:MAG: hypothetical protein KAR87_03235 [Candidatus Aenigmarchaeota archaeon]|nr:hypothetical protein [Candidatus Aenigmarchaeota archaeon]